LSVGVCAKVCVQAHHQQFCN